MKHTPTIRERALCRGLAEILVPELQIVARTQGYALLSHGSLERDIDLVAVPWVEEAVAADVLAEAIRERAEKVTGYAFIAPHEENNFPRQKPHGRLAWSFHLGGGPYIDLSVMSRVVDAVRYEMGVPRLCGHGVPYDKCPALIDNRRQSEFGTPPNDQIRSEKLDQAVRVARLSVPLTSSRCVR